MSIVLMSLGSNLGDRVKNINAAIVLISQKIGKIITNSPFYESKSWGVKSAFDYINACALLETDLTPEETLEVIHEIEYQLGRRRGDKYADRPIDIDILLFDHIVLSTPHLTIPHPLMHERLFVLVPANQIVPTLEHPIFKKSVQELLLECPDETNVYEYIINDEEAN